MLYIVGLGLNHESISKEGLDIARKCKRIYLENYTVDFPYVPGAIEALVLKKIIPADRKKVESLEIVDEAKKLDVALLVYGSPLTATTHIALIQEAKRMRVKYKVIYNASVIDAVAETGLQLYKFGKTASMPAWNSAKNYEPDSFMEILKDNQSINAHSLILIDIGLEFQEALKQLEISAKKHDVKLNNLIVCQTLGTVHQKIFYKNIKELQEFTEIRKPYCIILLSKLHFVEEEMLESFR